MYSPKKLPTLTIGQLTAGSIIILSLTIVCFLLIQISRHPSILFGQPENIFRLSSSTVTNTTANHQSLNQLAN
jgi:hypothetical protein